MCVHLQKGSKGGKSSCVRGRFPLTLARSRRVSEAQRDQRKLLQHVRMAIPHECRMICLSNVLSFRKAGMMRDPGRGRTHGSTLSHMLHKSMRRSTDPLSTLPAATSLRVENTHNVVGAVVTQGFHSTAYDAAAHGRTTLPLTSVACLAAFAATPFPSPRPALPRPVGSTTL